MIVEHFIKLEISLLASRPNSTRLPSGVHRVLNEQQFQEMSGVDDDFSFKCPNALKKRSRSSPDMDETKNFGYASLFVSSE